MSAHATDSDADSCRFCGGVGGDVEATVLDESGGAFVNLCSGCIEQLTTERCRLCGELKEDYQKADSVVLHQAIDGETAYPICDGCRAKMAFGGGQRD